MGAGKWVSHLKRTTRIPAAARHVLTLRLEAVRDALPPAVREPGKDVEHVHRLRVATRRADAALNVFSCCLPPRDFRYAKKQVRKIRRAAGAARDWDVFLEQLERLLPGAPRRAAERWRDFLLGFAMAQRARAQDELRAVAEDFPFAFDRLLAETVAAVHAPGAPGCVVLSDLVPVLLAGPIENINAATRQVPEDYYQLHQLRIAGKRLRYALEIFGDCLAEPFRDRLYDAVEEMQTILGRVNDDFVACRRLEELRAWLETLLPRVHETFRGSLDRLLRHHQERLPIECQAFQKWCANWQQSGSGATVLASLGVTSAAS
jgi:CHAD domain-containing protein